jgi:rhodanese-related sulfurtransferase
MTTALIDSNIRMRDLLAQYPGAQRALFRKYHIGGCSSCGFSPDETLAELCARNEQLPVEEVAEHIVRSHEADEKMQIAPADAAKALQNDSAARLIDVRTREEFEAVQIKGAFLLSQELMQEILARWDKEALLTIIDHHGTRSMDATAYFIGHGFHNAKSVRGGIDAWSVEVDPTLPRYELQ